MTDYMLYFILCTSIVFNVFFIWYIRNLLSQLYFVANNMSDLVDETISFRDHLSSVYELEMFYGDETLRHLIRHAKDITDVFDAYDDYPDEDTEMYDYDNDYEQTEEA